MEKNNFSENELIVISRDFKDRMEIKNNKISELKKIIFMLYGLIRRGLETSDTALFEESRSVISEYFEEELEI